MLAFGPFANTGEATDNLQPNISVILSTGMQHNDTISNVINGNQYTELNVLNLNFTDAKQF